MNFNNFCQEKHKKYNYADYWNWPKNKTIKHGQINQRNYCYEYSTPQIYGDCDCDDDVDFEDFVILASYWMELWPIGDFAGPAGEGNPDSKINNYDLKVFASNWLESL